MERTYSGHQDDKNNEDLSLHETSCRKVEELICSSGLSFTIADNETIMKDCYQYVLSNGVALQVISANIGRTPSSQKAITIEHKGPYIKGKKTAGFFSGGRIRKSKADVIAFVIYENNNLINIIFVEPSSLVDYLDGLYKVLKESGTKTITNCSSPKEQAIQEWNMAYKTDSSGRKRIIAPILINDLEDRQVNLLDISPKPQEEAKPKRKSATKPKTVISKTQNSSSGFEISIKGQNMNLQMTIDSQDTIRSVLKVLMPI